MLDIIEKAVSIYKDVHDTAERTAMFNILVIAKYLLAIIKQKTNFDESMMLINDALSLLRKYSNQAQILFALVQKMYIKLAECSETEIFDLETEALKLTDLKNKLPNFLND